MTTPAQVYGLDSYGLTLAALARLGAREVGATVQLSGKPVRQLLGLPPVDRSRVQRETLNRQLARLRRAHPGATLVPRNRLKPWTIDATLPARFDAEDATRRLGPMWLEYAEPSMNPAGELVRWQLVSIQDVYEGYDESIDPRGTEIYSRLRRVRMKPEYRWTPRRTRR